MFIMHLSSLNQSVSSVCLQNQKIYKKWGISPQDSRTVQKLDKGSLLKCSKSRKLCIQLEFSLAFRVHLYFMMVIGVRLLTHNYKI
jgi:hypothetical protein